MEPYSDSGARCAVCGRGLPAGASFCPGCGAEARSDAPQAKCAKCGGGVPAGSRFCPRCGMPDWNAEAGSNKYAWALALMPLPTWLLDTAVTSMVGADEAMPGCILLVFLLGVQLVLLVADVQELRRSLNPANARREISTALWALGGLLLMPAYLWRRASISDGRYGPLVAWLCAALLIICVSLDAVGAR